MPMQSLPPLAAAYSRRSRALTRRTLAAVVAQWRRVGVNFEAGWTLAGPAIMQAIAAAQLEATREGTEFVPAVLAATGQPVRDAEYTMARFAAVGTAGDGRPVESLMYGAVVTARTAVSEGATPYLALSSGSKFLQLATATLLSDTRRAAETVAMGARHVTGYVRMLNPPSCGRCIILAGKRFRQNQGFDRHPGCDCTHIPASESIAGDMLVDSRGYLETLDETALARALGSKANAQAFTDGADFNQLINAYRKTGDVMTAQVYGSTIKFTGQGRNVVWTGTRRNGSTYTAGKSTGWSYRFSGGGQRWMPETIYKFAADREHAIELLRQYGWIV